MLEDILNPNSPFPWILIGSLIAAAMAIIARYFSSYVRFIYPNAKYEAIGNPFLQEKELNSLLQQKNLQEFKERLNILKDYQISGDEPKTIQDSLDNHFIQSVHMMKKDSTKKLHAFYDLYLQKTDFYHIKNEIKKSILGQKTNLSSDNVAFPQTKKILLTLRNTSKEDLPKLFSTLGFDQELISALLAEAPDLVHIDVLFDRYMLSQFKKTKVPYKCEQPKQDFIKNMIDLLTIKHLLRAKQLQYTADVCKHFYLGEGKEILRWRFIQMAESNDVIQMINALDGTSYHTALSTQLQRYNKEKTVQVFETSIHEVFIQRIRNISLKNYLTVGPLIRFLVSKEFEIKNLKVIAKAIEEKLPLEVIKNYLVREVSS